jgi:hypothetical protein
VVAFLIPEPSKILNSWMNATAKIKKEEMVRNLFEDDGRETDQIEFVISCCSFVPAKA